jgi:hypothetical protein
MGQVIDLQEWRRRHPAGAAKAAGSSLPWRAQQVFWAEPILLSSLAVWQDAAVMWASIVLTASTEVGFAQAGGAPASTRAAVPFEVRP